MSKPPATSPIADRLPTPDDPPVARLKAAMEEVLRLLDGVGGAAGDLAHGAGGASLDQRMQGLEARIAELDDDNGQLAERLVEVEAQTRRLMSLYVATYQLHATLDPAEVQKAIAEIATNLLGISAFALLLSDEARGDCEVALAQAVEADLHEGFEGARYRGGDALVDATLEDGAPRFGPAPESSALAVIPLTVEGLTVGALVILELLAHKARFDDVDRELLDLLAAHTASALFAAQLFANTHQKLKTLEGLVRLVRGPDA